MSLSQYKVFLVESEKKNYADRISSLLKFVVSNKPASDLSTPDIG